MPAEFAPHLGCIMIWPERTDSWRNGGYAARAAFTKIATAIAASEQVTMLVSNQQYETARAMLSPEVRLVECTTENASFYLSDWLVLLYHILVGNATKRRMVAKRDSESFSLPLSF